MVGNKQIKFGLIMVLFLVFGVVSCTEKGAMKKVVIQRKVVIALKQKKTRQKFTEIIL